MALKLNDLSIDIRQLGSSFILTGISDDFLYENGQKSSTRIGTRYEVAMPSLRLEKMVVKIPGPQTLSESLLESTSYCNVIFDGLEVHFYSNGRGFSLTAKADAIALAE